MMGRVITAKVQAPAKMEYPMFKNPTKSERNNAHPMPNGRVNANPITTKYMVLMMSGNIP